MHTVFLSYARDDRARAKSIAAALERAGMSVWWDRRLAAGSEYSKEIEQALKSAKAVVVLWSRSSIDSPWVRDEAGKGRDSGRLVPATIDGTEAPLGFGQFHTIDLSGRNWKKGPLSELVAAAAEKAGPQGAGAVPHAVAEGRTGPSSRALAIGAGVVALAAAAAIFFFFALPDGNSAGAPDSPGGRIAIAGFVPLADDSESKRVARLAEGAVERTFATNFIHTLSEQSASQDALNNADFTLRGTVDGNGEEVVILASVVDPASGRTLWSTEVARPAGENRQLTEELAIFLADVIRCSTYTKRRMPGYDSPEVFSRIFRSCEAERTGGEQYMQLPAVSQALVDVAPESAQAWAYLANTTAFVYPDRQDEVRAAAKKALELDPKNGAVRWSLALLPDPNVSLAERERLLREGLKLDPEFLWHRNHLAHLMRKVGRTEEAATHYQEFVSTYPLDHQIRAWAAYLRAQQGAIVEAREDFARIAEVRPWFDGAWALAIRAEIVFGDLDRARRLMDATDAADGDRPCLDMVIEALRSKRTLTVEQIRRGCDEGRGIVHPAQVRAKFGHTDAVFDFLRSAGPQRSATLGPFYIYEPDFAPVRADPRFIPLLVPLGIPQYWLETNKWPDFCREDTLPYDCREAAEAAVSAAVERR